jgi:hypothetical protein
MSILTVLLILIFIGAGLWAVTAYLPVAQLITSIIARLTVALTVLWLLQISGLLDTLSVVRIGRGRW